MALDKWGICPCCSVSWDGGDMFEHLQTIDALAVKTNEDLMRIAKHYGYDNTDKKHFSKLKVVVPINQNEAKILHYLCPMCGTKFNTEGEIIKNHVKPEDKFE